MKIVRTRRIDGGEPLLLLDPPHGPEVAAYAVSTAVCDNPDCPCTRMYLSIRPAAQTTGGILQVRGPELEAEVSADGSDLRLAESSTGAFPAEVRQWLRDELTQEDSRGWLCERWRRMRGQLGDPAYPLPAPPERRDWMCSFSEVFPYDFDLTVVHDRRLFLADDQYCLQPGCACEEVVVSFVDATQARGLGHARASIHQLQEAQIEGTAVTRQLWSAFLEQHESTVLRRRFTRMRSAARNRPPSPHHQAPRKASRNAPCPCGSGKKFKRCCAAPAPHTATTTSPD